MNQERHNPLSLRETRSLAWHSEIAQRIERDPTLLEFAIANLDRWRERHGEESGLYAQWRKILTEETPVEIIELLRSESEESKLLRQATPFTGVLSQEEPKVIADTVEREVHQVPTSCV